MKALLVRSPGDFGIVQRPDPIPAADHAIIRIHRTGICATDLATIQGRSTVAQYPITPGHEFVGTIECVPAKSGYRVGEWVTIYPTRGCGTCEACVNGAPNHCRSFGVIGVARDGGAFAERVSVPVDQLIRIPEALRNDHGALIEPLAVGVHAIRRAGCKPSRRIAIIGAGTVGVMVAQVARAQGVTDIVLVDRMEVRRALCQDLGFENFILADHAGLSRELAALGPRDIVFDNACTGATLEAAIECMRPGGTLVPLGFPHDAGDIPVPYAKAYKFEISIIFSRNYARADFTDAIQLLGEGHINAARMVTGTWRLDQFLEAYEALTEHPGDHVKVMIAP